MIITVNGTVKGMVIITHKGMVSITVKGTLRLTGVVKGVVRIAV